MPFSLRYDPEAECVLAVIEGRADARMAREFTRELVSLFRKTGCKRLLNDMRLASLEMSILEIDDIPAMSSEAGIDETCSGAILVSGDDEKFSFLQATCNIRHQYLKIFTDYDEAREWLMKRKKNSQLELSV